MRQQPVLAGGADRPAAQAGYRGLSPRWILAVAAIANLLVFVRIAVLYAPQYSYQGPNGADKVLYYAYTRSLVIDRDVDFRNEVAIHPPSSQSHFYNGRPAPQYPIGSPALAIPAFAATHFVIVVANALGATGIKADGYSASYALAYALSQMAWALFGMYLFFRAASTYFSERIAATAVVAGWFGTNALRYTAVDVGMSHAASLFSIAWCSYESVTLREDASNWRRWWRLGASSAFLILVRYQNGVYLLVPAAAVALVLARRWRAVSVGQAVRHLLAGAGGAGLVFLPQLFVWRGIYGAWFANTYGSEVGLANWLRPHILTALFDGQHGLTVWLPVLAVSLGGCLCLAASRKDLVALAAVAAWFMNAYVTAAFPWPGNVLRSSFDTLFPVVLGFGWWLTAAGGRGAIWSIGLVGLFMAWSVPFSAVVGGPVQGAGESFFAGWMQCVLTLLHVK